MSPIKSPKQKGSSFERKICKDLSLWVSDGKRDDLFWRSAISGGRATVRAKKGQTTANQAGDITATDPMGYILTDSFVCECKHYKDLEWSSFIYGKGFIWKTWEKLLAEAVENNKMPFLIVKQNNQPEIVFFSWNTIFKIRDSHNISPFLQNVYFGMYHLKTILENVRIENITKR